MTKVIHESCMNFIADNTFHIEQSEAYGNVKNDKIKTVEFLRIRRHELLFIEAKRSFPHKDNSPERYEEEVQKICDKFIHSLQIFLSSSIGVTKREFAADFVLPEDISLVFVLVVQQYKEAWCRRPRSDLLGSLPHWVKRIWRPEVRVYNQEIATEDGLLSI